MKFKKPKFWDFKKPNIYAYLLLPIAFFFKILKLIRSKLKTKSLNIKTICIGNIYIGGTGKTSLCIKVNIKGVCELKNFFPTSFCQLIFDRLFL